MIHEAERVSKLGFNCLWTVSNQRARDSDQVLEVKTLLQSGISR